MITRYCTWWYGQVAFMCPLQAFNWASNYSELQATTETKVLSGCVSINITNQMIILRFTKPQLPDVRHIVLLVLRTYNEFRPTQFRCRS